MSVCVCDRRTDLQRKTDRDRQIDRQIDTERGRKMKQEAFQHRITNTHTGRDKKSLCTSGSKKQILIFTPTETIQIQKNKLNPFNSLNHIIHTTETLK